MQSKDPSSPDSYQAFSKLTIFAILYLTVLLNSHARIVHPFRKSFTNMKKMIKSCQRKPKRKFKRRRSLSKTGSMNFKPPKESNENRIAGKK